MFELLLHGLAAGSWAADHTVMLAGAGQIKEQPHMAAKDLFQNHQLNLVAGPNEVYNSGVESGGAPWSTNSYDVRPTDTAGLQAEGGPAGPYTCDTDGFACSVFNSQAFDNGVVPTMPMLDKDASAAMRAHHNAMAYQLYTNFGVGAELSHPRIGPGGSSGDLDTSAWLSGGGGGGPPGCSLAEDCNGLA